MSSVTSVLYMYQAWTCSGVGRREDEVPVRHAVALPDGTVASGSADGTVRLWRDGEAVATLWGHRGTVRCLAVFPDGMLASGSADNAQRETDDDDDAFVSIAAWIFSF